MSQGIPDERDRREGRAGAALDLFGQLASDTSNRYPVAHPRGTALRAIIPLALGAALGTGWFGTGCDAGDAEPTPLDRPDIQLLSVTATVAVENGSLVKEQVDAGELLVLPTTSITLKFDRYLLATDVIRQAIYLRSNTAPVATPIDCEGGLFLRPSYNPVSRELTFFQQDQDAELVPDTLYRLTVFRPDPNDPEALGVRAFDGAPLSATQTFDLRTAAASPNDPPREGLPAGDLFCEPEECLVNCGADSDCRAACGSGARTIFSGSCAFSLCHEDVREDKAAMGFNLSSAALIRATAIGQVANQTETGENADLKVESGLKFGRAMPRIDPGNPGNSYMMYKLLADGTAEGPDDTLAPGENTRLRNSLVVGLPMPPSNLAKLTRVDALNLANWIATGADMSCEP